MKTFLKTIFVLALCLGWYHIFVKPLVDTESSSSEDAQQHAQTPAPEKTKGDTAAFQAYLNTSVAPYLQTTAAGQYSYTAPSGKVFKYKISKSGLFYCPIQKKKIYRNISINFLPH